MIDLGFPEGCIAREEELIQLGRRNIRGAEHLMDLAAMVDLMQEKMCENHMHGIRALPAFNRGPVDCARQPRWLDKVAKADELSIGC